jgi:hypothetical protein
LHHCDKISEINKGEQVYFGSWFQRFQFKVGCFRCFGPEARQKIMAPGVVAEKAAHLLVARKQRERERGLDKIGFSRACTSDLLPSTKPHLLQPIQYELISGLIHWCCLCPHDPVVTSQ